MDELIGQLADLLSMCSESNGEKNELPNTNDITDMISSAEELLKLKDKEISAFHKLFCASARSFKNTQAPVLVDATCEQAKKEYDKLETFRKVLKTLKPIDVI